MCGIAGFAGSGSRDVLERMIRALKHRGPDDEGTLIRGDVGLGHKRLAIIDISPAGHQPMFGEGERVAIVFNGEIFNFRELRDELEKAGMRFRSSSDTEVILALYRKFGDRCFEKLVGQFAIGLYDFEKHALLLARDRMGEKPLYWTLQKGTLLFASELKALLEAGVPRELDMESLNQYLLLDYVPTPRTMLRGVYKLEPATVLTYTNGSITKRCFWRPPHDVRNISEHDALEKLDALLARSVSRQLLAADVPVGVFLSGGIDSSTVACYAQKSSSRPIETFAIGFDDASFDESAFARQVAAHIGTSHHEERLRPDDALELVTNIPEVFSEPVADASVLPTMLVSRFARKSVTVALGGDGGDELFAGYPTFLAEVLFGYYRRIPRVLRRMAARTVALLPASHAYLPLSYNAKKFMSVETPDPLQRHLEWLGTFTGARRAEIAGRALHDIAEKSNAFSHIDAYRNEVAPENQLLWLYARTFLMDQVMVKVDRASMHYALETRAPFLDHEVVDFVFSLPYGMKYRSGTSKYLLKKLMKDKLPSAVVSRKKQGFSMPMARWLTGPLRGLCDELLSPSALRAHGLFDETVVARIKDEHMSRRHDNRKELWNLMVFQMWYNRWMS